MYRFRKQKNSS